MATTTPNLGLKKPEETDNVKVSDLNGNADLLDRIIGELSELNTKQKESLVAAINEALGKSAYAAAQEGGYTGTEAQFNTDLAAVGGKQAKITASGILKGDGAGGVSAAEAGTDYVASPEVFIATYGTTTYAEIKAAHLSGKLCVCRNGAAYAPLVRLTGASAIFACVFASSNFFRWVVTYGSTSGDTWEDSSGTGYVPVAHASTHASDGDDPITPASIGAAAESVGVSAALSASGWDADAKTQTVIVAGVTAGTNGSLRIAQSATDEQFAAWGAAQPRVTAQADGSITVKLSGTVPTIDIPVEVLIV